MFVHGYIVLAGKLDERDDHNEVRGQQRVIGEDINHFDQICHSHERM